ncbi:MAG: acylphosphatase [Elusimicrobiota bacterium]
MVETKSFLAKGKVQGVGFRWFVKQTAARFSVTGWVKNRSDGAVEGEITGESSRIIAFLKALESGNPLAKVSSIETCSLEKKDFSSFEIKF